MLRSHADLEEGQVYLFKDERYCYQLNSQYGQYENLMGVAEPHTFTRWPAADLSQDQTPNTLYLGDEEVDKLIAEQTLTEI